MNSLAAFQKLLTLGSPLFTTNEAAGAFDVSTSHASQILVRLAKASLVVSLMRGRWALKKDIDPLVLPEFLTAPFPSYVSLQTALYFHGMISQVPQTIYAVTLDRTRTITTPLGTISYHHISPEFFFGFEMHSERLKMATPEKALMDFFYLTSARSLLFQTLPELELPKSFQWRKAEEIISHAPNERMKTILKHRLSETRKATNDGRTTS